MGLFGPTGGGGGTAGVSSVNTRTGAVTLAASDILSGTFDIARIPVLPSQKQIVSSGAIANLTTAQQAEIDQGTIVTTTDGRRWVYTGTGSKTLEASYINLADVSPDWNAIENRPSTFAPSAHASSHASTGADAITPTSIGAEPTITNLSVAKGGTGATTASDARTNLGALGSNITGLTGATAIGNIVQITATGYSLITTPSANTLYIIVG